MTNRASQWHKQMEKNVSLASGGKQNRIELLYNSICSGKIRQQLGLLLLPEFSYCRNFQGGGRSTLFQALSFRITELMFSKAPQVVGKLKTFLRNGVSQQKTSQSEQQQLTPEEVRTSIQFFLSSQNLLPQVSIRIFQNRFNQSWQFKSGPQWIGLLVANGQYFILYTQLQYCYFEKSICAVRSAQQTESRVLDRRREIPKEACSRFGNQSLVLQKTIVQEYARKQILTSKVTSSQECKETASTGPSQNYKPRRLKDSLMDGQCRKKPKQKQTRFGQVYIQRPHRIKIDQKPYTESLQARKAATPGSDERAIPSWFAARQKHNDQYFCGVNQRDDMDKQFHSSQQLFGAHSTRVHPKRLPRYFPN